MAGSVTKWLEDLGLGQYSDAFEENAIGFHLLSGLTDEDLREIGVTKLGHRKELLSAIARLPAGVAKQDDPIAPTTSPTQSEAERRHLTVMFVDLVGSTALSAASRAR